MHVNFQRRKYKWRGDSRYKPDVLINQVDGETFCTFNSLFSRLHYRDTHVFGHTVKPHLATASGFFHWSLTLFNDEEASKLTPRVERQTFRKLVG